jgi:hypothetical protein
MFACRENSIRRKILAIETIPASVIGRAPPFVLRTVVVTWRGHRLVTKRRCYNGRRKDCAERKLALSDMRSTQGMSEL